MALLILFLAAAGGAGLTLLWDEGAGLLDRFCAGAPLGIALLGLAGYALASVAGLSRGTVGLAVAAVALPAALLWLRRARLAPWRRPRVLVAAGLVLLGLGLAATLDRALLVSADGAIATGDDHNLGDLPFHLGVISGFVYGGNLPPEHPELLGSRLTYPFAIDFVSAMLVVSGAPLRDAVVTLDVVLGWSLVGLLYRFLAGLAGGPRRGLAATALALGSGGLGFRMLARDVDPAEGGLVGLLQRLPRDYTIVPTGEYRWGNVVTTMLIPQRSFLLGLPLFLVVATQLWRVCASGSPDDPAVRRRLAAAGAVAGLVPFVHGHAFAVAMSVAAALAVLFPPRVRWAWFFAPATLLAGAQVAWLFRDPATKASAFLAWHVGWDRGDQNAAWFWLANLGLFLPLVLAALLWRRLLGRGVLRFYVPFALCFVVPNVLRLSPWIWDNVKFLVFWHVASCALVAALLGRLWRSGRTGALAAALAFVVLTASAALDLYRVGSGSIEQPIFSASAVRFAAEVRAHTAPRAVVLHAPGYNSLVLLTGRRSVLGYPGHIWSQGLDGGKREEEIASVYAGEPGSFRVLDRYRVDHILVGPQEGQPSLADDVRWAFRPGLEEPPYVLLDRTPARP